MYIHAALLNLHLCLKVERFRFDERYLRLTLEDTMNFSRSFTTMASATTLARPLSLGWQQCQCRYMSKYLSNSATKRLPLTTKRARKGFYKGNGATKEGTIRKGKFKVDFKKRLEIIVPKDLENFELRPYIASTSSRYPPEERSSPTPT